MSETLPPITGNGVILNFIFPFDDAVERKARICWRRTLGGQNTDTEYARVEQSGDTTVVLQQVSFKGDPRVALVLQDDAHRFISVPSITPGLALRPDQPTDRRLDSFR